jgi:hypothetical protein
MNRCFSQSYFCPEDLRESLERYVEQHNDPGSFLRACLENNLLLACVCADENNVKHLPEVVQLITKAVPSVAWGNLEKVENWIANK